jgi:Bacterial extracellular solute-binding proteins, family 5 Middle
VILDANPHAATPPGVTRVVIRHMKDPSTQLLSLQRGDIDIARNLGADQLKSLAGNSNFHTIAAPQGTSMYFAMNRAVPELAKKEVQQAIKWAIDYEAIAKNITPGVWRVSQSFLPEGLPGALAGTPFHKGTAKARQLLAAAGLSGSFSVSMDYSSSWPLSDIAQPLQADLGAIGIKLQLLPGELKQVITKTRAAASDGAADVAHRLYRPEFQRAGLVRRPGRFRRQQAEDPRLAQSLRRQGHDGRGGSGDQGTRQQEAHGDLCRSAAPDVGSRAVRVSSAGRRDRRDAEARHRLSTRPTPDYFRYAPIRKA